MGRYRKRPVEVEAFHYKGPSQEFADWVGQWADSHGGIQPGGARVDTEEYEPGHPIVLLTEQGEWVACRPGEWIICDRTPGRFYPCDPEVFAAGYEPADGRAWGA